MLLKWATQCSLLSLVLRATNALLIEPHECGDETMLWPSSHGAECEALEDTISDAEKWLIAAMPPQDKSTQSMLELGVLPDTVNLSCVVRQQTPWGKSVPKDIWMHNILPYANADEPRSSWRRFMFDKLFPLVKNAQNISEAVAIVNEHLWSDLRPSQDAVTFVAGQTPVIYDPMSVLVYGYGSCTGISILFVDALRAVGVPARLVGTAAWNGEDGNGNHNWVEIWMGQKKGYNGDDWMFMEGKPAGTGALTDACAKWFCKPTRFDGNTKVFTPVWGAKDNKTVYTMAWDLKNLDIPGLERTDYYNTICQECQ